MLVRSYVQRHCMEARLEGLPPSAAPPGVELRAWRPDLLESHARVKCLSFEQTLDALLFPCLSRLDGCLELMRSIASHAGFVAEATWLAIGSEGPCGAIQGLAGAGNVGMIQNLAVLPGCRGRGIGRALLLAALHGFRVVGLDRAQLEVSVQNLRAVRLYRSVGFQVRRTFYREARCELREYAI